MADVFQTQYRQEFVKGFEDRASVLRATATTESMVKGNQATFLIAGALGEEAVTRGANGLIQARADTNTQVTATLNEWHDLRRRTKFNLFASQGDGRRIMQMNSMSVLNRKIDDLFIAALDTATNDTGAAVTASLDLVIKAQVILGNNFVDTTDEDNLFALVTPAFMGYMMQNTEFASADYVDVKPFNGPARRFRRWGGFNWIVHPRLTGSVGAGGTGSSEQCYFYHRDAIGCGADVAGMDTEVGYDGEQAYSWARTSIHLGCVRLQNSGIVQAVHNGSAYVAS